MRRYKQLCDNHRTSGNIREPDSRSDSIICEGSLFNELSASDPIGGDGVTYSYLWQESLDNFSWSDAYGINTNQKYLPDTSRFAVEEQIYYRRRVLSGPHDVCLDYGSPILMTRYHKIEDNTIAANDVICAGSDPVALTGSLPSAVPVYILIFGRIVPLPAHGAMLARRLLSIHRRSRIPHGTGG